jgi:hypothetical protein
MGMVRPRAGPIKQRNEYHPANHGRPQVKYVRSCYNPENMQQWGLEIQRDDLLGE